MRFVWVHNVLGDKKCALRAVAQCHQDALRERRYKRAVARRSRRSSGLRKTPSCRTSARAWRSNCAAKVPRRVACLPERCTPRLSSGISPVVRAGKQGGEGNGMMVVGALCQDNPVESAEDFGSRVLLAPPRRVPRKGLGTEGRGTHLERGEGPWSRSLSSKVSAASIAKQARIDTSPRIAAQTSHPCMHTSARAGLHQPQFLEQRIVAFSMNAEGELWSLAIKIERMVQEHVSGGVSLCASPDIAGLQAPSTSPLIARADPVSQAVRPCTRSGGPRPRGHSIVV